MFKLTKFQSQLTMLFNCGTFTLLLIPEAIMEWLFGRRGGKMQFITTSTVTVNLIWVFTAHQDYFNHFESSLSLGGPIG